MPSEPSKTPDIALIDRTTRWQEHNPASIDVIGNPRQRDSTDKVIDIGGTSMSPQEAYDLAKRHGDKRAAFGYTEYLFEQNLSAVDAIREKYDKLKPIILPIVSKEKMAGDVYKYNAIPAAFASLLQSRTGWEIQGEDNKQPILQVTKAGRTGAQKIESFTKQAYFEGPVQKGRNYIIVDDHVAKGGTIANLIDYIEKNGGRVVAASALVIASPNTGLKPTRSAIHAAEKTVGEKNFGELHRLMFGQPLKDPLKDCLFTWAELKSITQQEHEAKREYESQPGQRWPSKLDKQQEITYGYIRRELDAAIAIRREQTEASAAATGLDEPRSRRVETGTSEHAGRLPQEDRGPEGPEERPQQRTLNAADTVTITTADATASGWVDRVGANGAARDRAPVKKIPSRETLRQLSPAASAPSDLWTESTSRDPNGVAIT
jgi:hypothetical protein